MCHAKQVLFVEQMLFSPVAVIPARLASTRLPRKPLQLLGGEPLIVRVCERVAQTGLFAQIIVACDDTTIAECVEAAGFNALLTDPALPSGTDRVAAVAKTLAFGDDQLIVNVQGDEPFVPKVLLASVLDKLRSDLRHIVTAVTPVTTAEQLLNPNVVKAALGAEGRLLYFSRAAIPYVRDQQKELDSLPWHFRHIGIYAYAANTLRQISQLPEHPLEQLEKLEQLRWLAHGYTMRAVVEDAGEPGIDTPEDLRRANTYYVEHQQQSE